MSIRSFALALVLGWGCAVALGQAPPPPPPTGAELAEKLMKIAADTPQFDMIGDASSPTGRQIKALLKTSDARVAALHAVLPIALDESRSRADRDDALRLLGSVFNRARNDDGLEPLFADEALRPGLEQLAKLTHVRASALVDEFIATAPPTRHIPVPQDASAVQAEAQTAQYFLPQCLYLLGNLGDEAAIRGLYEEASAKTKRATKDDPTTPERLRSSLHRGGTFPDTMFVWNLGRLKGDWGAEQMLRIFRTARKNDDETTLTAALDAMQWLTGSRPELMEELRAMIDAVPPAKPVDVRPDWPEGVAEAAPYAEWSGPNQYAAKRYVSLGIEHYKATRDLPENHGEGDLAWLKVVLEWVTRPDNQHEPSIVTLFRAGNAEVALLQVTEPDLMRRLVPEILPKLGTGSQRRRGQNLLWVLSRLPIPTKGDGEQRRLSDDFVAALGRAWLATNEHGYMLDMSIRACGAWARGTALEDWARTSLHTEPHASIVLAHILGASGAAEFHELRPEGTTFTGTLREAEVRERDRVQGLREQVPVTFHMYLCQQALTNAGVAQDQRAARAKSFSEKCEPLFADAELTKYEYSRDYREAMMKKLREALIETCGDEKFLPPDSEWSGMMHALFSQHDLWRGLQDTYGYDWNFTRAERIIAMYERLEGSEAADAMRVVAELRQRREDMIWEIGKFDVYAFVPTMIMVYEQASQRFGASDALALRKAILQAFAAFRSVTGRDFIEQVRTSPTSSDAERAYAEGLKPRTLKSLSDEAH